MGVEIFQSIEQLPIDPIPCSQALKANNRCLSDITASLKPHELTMSGEDSVTFCTYLIPEAEQH